MFTFSLELRSPNFKNAFNFGQTGPQRLWVNFLLLPFYVTGVCVCVCVCELKGEGEGGEGEEQGKDKLQNQRVDRRAES